jgi:hypothetical protein
MYAAETALGAFIEVFRTAPFIPQMEVETRLLAMLHTTSSRRLADCTSARARAFGVTAEIHSTRDYPLCQRWAGALADAGFEGIRYLVRHDPSANEIGIALFGDAGHDETLIVESDGPITAETTDEARRRFGVLVLPSPSL